MSCVQCPPGKKNDTLIRSNQRHHLEIRVKIMVFKIRFLRNQLTMNIICRRTKDSTCTPLLLQTSNAKYPYRHIKDTNTQMMKYAAVGGWLCWSSIYSHGQGKCWQRFNTNKALNLTHNTDYRISRKKLFDRLFVTFRLKFWLRATNVIKWEDY